MYGPLTRPFFQICIQILIAHIQIKHCLFMMQLDKEMLSCNCRNGYRPDLLKIWITRCSACMGAICMRHARVSSLTVTLVLFCKDFPSSQLSSSFIPMQDRITLVGSISWILNSFSTVPLEESLDSAPSDPFDDAPSPVLNIPPVSAITPNSLKCCVDGIGKRKKCLSSIFGMFAAFSSDVDWWCHAMLSCFQHLSTKTYPMETRCVIAFICPIYMLYLSKGISD